VGADEKSSATTGTTISLYHNTTLWCLYIDLERNFGTFETTRTAYRRMLDIKLITPYILLNYAELLENNHYYEESFKVYETGVTVFFWPGAYDIWLIYLSKFVERYGGDKLERARDLFEKVLVSVPDKVF
jgi:pre-mRNA-splicing factor SYF1